MKKKLLILGGTGFLGFNILKYAIKKNFSIVSVSKTKKPNIGIKDKKNVIFLNLDITYKKNLLKLFNKYEFDYIINASGYVNHSKDKKIIKEHFILIKNLINVLKNKKIKSLIQLSSGLEYGNYPPPHFENGVCKPRSLYAKSKNNSTKLLMNAFKKNGFPMNVLRLYQVYGPYQEDNRIIPFIINSSLQNNSFPCSEGKQKRDFLYIDDLINFIDLIFKNKIKGEIFNVGFGRSSSLKKVISLVVKYLKKGKPKFGEIKLRKDELMDYYPNISKAKKLLNWHPKFSLIEGMIKTIKFYKKKSK